MSVWAKTSYQRLIVRRGDFNSNFNLQTSNVSHQRLLTMDTRYDIPGMRPKADRAISCCSMTGRVAPVAGSTRVVLLNRASKK
jgi:hypothetical protein